MDKPSGLLPGIDDEVVQSLHMALEADDFERFSAIVAALGARHSSSLTPPELLLEFCLLVEMTFTAGDIDPLTNPEGAAAFAAEVRRTYSPRAVLLTRIVSAMNSGLYDGGLPANEYGELLRMLEEFGVTHESGMLETMQPFLDRIRCSD